MDEWRRIPGSGDLRLLIVWRRARLGVLGRIPAEPEAAQVSGQNWPALFLHAMAVLVGLILGAFAFTYTGDGIVFALISGLGGGLAVYLAAQLSRIAIKDK